MIAPAQEKLFGGRVPPLTFWLLLAGFGLALLLNGPAWVVLPLAGLALGVYFVWAWRQDAARDAAEERERSQ